METTGPARSVDLSVGLPARRSHRGRAFARMYNRQTLVGKKVNHKLRFSAKDQSSNATRPRTVGGDFAMGGGKKKLRQTHSRERNADLQRVINRDYSNGTSRPALKISLMFYTEAPEEIFDESC